MLDGINPLELDEYLSQYLDRHLNKYIAQYLREHLSVQVVSNRESCTSYASIEVKLLLDNEVISSDFGYS
jgi:hypothetical protein